MIKLPRNFFTNLSTTQYREYLKLLPNLSDKKIQLYTMLAFTLAAMSFFGIFAINPTLSTIAELNRQLKDLRDVKDKLIIKVQNLTTLQEKYQSLTGDLPVVFDAMPQKPEVPKLLAQINGVLSRSNLQSTSLRTYGVEITPGKQISSERAASFVFSLEAEGTYEDIISFIQKVTHINRLITIETVSIAKDDKKAVLILNLRGREYFKP
jgi:Tfp pilus assembly protein PilO